MEQNSLTYQGKPRTYGFRLSTLDVWVLIVGVGIGFIAWFYMGELSFFVPFVVIHFFLFCNVFRIRRTPELIWAGLFLGNCFVWNALGQIEVVWIFASQLLVTLIIIANELRHPHYHGVFARRLNPKIDAYLAGKLIN